jgi:hypothetical protein
MLSDEYYMTGIKHYVSTGAFLLFGSFVHEIWAAKFNLNMADIHCNNGDRLKMYDTIVVDTSIGTSLLLDIDDVNIFVPFNMSAVIIIIQRSKPYPEISVKTFLCEKTSSYDYIGITTAICNISSIVFLFLTISIFCYQRSLKLQVASAVPNLCLSLLFAQLIFQVSYKVGIMISIGYIKRS